MLIWLYVIFSARIIAAECRVRISLSKARQLRKLGVIERQGLMRFALADDWRIVQGYLIDPQNWARAHFELAEHGRMSKVEIYLRIWIREPDKKGEPYFVVSAPRIGPGKFSNPPIATEDIVPAPRECNSMAKVEKWLDCQVGGAWRERDWGWDRENPAVELLLVGIDAHP